jgi:hypothetical protein
MKKIGMIVMTVLALTAILAVVADDMSAFCFSPFSPSQA